MTTRSNQIRRPRAIVVTAVLMIVFGIAEVVTGLTHNFFGVTTTQGSASAGPLAWHALQTNTVRQHLGLSDTPPTASAARRRTKTPPPVDRCRGVSRCAQAANASLA